MRAPTYPIQLLLLTVLIALPGAGLALSAGPAPRPLADVTVFGDAVAANWQDWSWSTTRNFAATAPVQSGANAIAVTYTAGWAGLSLRAPQAIPGSEVAAVTFWAHGGASGAQIRFNTYADDAGAQASTSLDLTLTAGVWTQHTLTLAALGNPAAIRRLNWQDRTGGAQPTFYLDQIVLTGPAGAPPTATTAAPGSGPALTINVAQARRAISPHIYGMNFAPEALAAEVDVAVNRWGGNSVTRYNWQNDTYNTASDWFFENIPNPNSNPGALPAGSASDQFVEANLTTGAESLITVPMIGWAAKRRTAGHPYDCGFSQAKYGAQQSADPYDPDCGNGRTPGGAALTGNDPTDTSVAIGPAFVTAWVNHLTSRYGTAAQGGVQFYNLDNEPDLWFETHRDVFPIALTYDQLRDRALQYAQAIKTADPTAQVLGPVVHGWTYYWHSPRDGQLGQWTTRPDRMAHGDVPLVPWFLGQMQAYEQANGQRLLDYLDLHYYPQAPNVALSPAGDAATQALRLRATRSLWDPTYTDESWIAGAGPEAQVALIPRMRAWVNTYYPGTKLAIGEYNWGGLESLNGALAQAEVLGVFGREGVDLATLWAPPTATQPGAYAFRMYRNYDSLGGKFGEVSVSALSANPGQLSVFAAERLSDGALTVMVINKTGGALTSPVTVAGFAPAATAQVFTYSGANLNAITAQPAQVMGTTGFTATFAANAITLVVIAPAGPVQRVYLPSLRR